MKNIDFDYYDTYSEWKVYLRNFYDNEYVKRGCFSNVKEFENTYLYQNVDLQNDERDRLGILLPLIRLEIEELSLTEESLEELEIYYDDFYKGIFDDLFTDEELKLVKEDLDWCYEHRLENLYKK